MSTVAALETSLIPNVDVRQPAQTSKVTHQFSGYPVIENTMETYEKPAVQMTDQLYPAVYEQDPIPVTKHHLQINEGCVASPDEVPLSEMAVPNIVPRQGMSPKYDARCNKLSGEVTADGPQADRLILTGLVPDSYRVRLQSGDICVVELQGNDVLLRNDKSQLVFGTFHEEQGRWLLTLNDEVSCQISDTITAPRSAWGQRGLMAVAMNDRIHAPYDAETKQEGKFIGSSVAYIAQYFQNHQMIGNSLTGIGHNFGISDITGANCASLNKDHGHAFDSGIELTFSDIFGIRNKAYWDNGISRELAGFYAEYVEQVVRRHLGNIDVKPDRMGLAFHIPDLKPEDVASPAFMEFFRGTGLSVHEGLRIAHKNLYGTEYNDTVMMSERAHREGITPEWRAQFKSMFPEIPPYDPKMGISREAYNNVKYLEKNNGLKRPFAWNFGLGFNEEGGIGTITMATRNVRGIGAIEGLGFRLERPTEWRSRLECEELHGFYRDAVDYAMQRL